ncbi:hypothetical protein [Knoellia subterranea]|uniref:Uncharacterized protein n=1 Tax=Knoellia subterranea KCTC 19937 TaxID=1385521 RepID=A0A0A0JN36_9MICO|nr:hypothetical protein [Knoellia subterranea]KGN37001.1 hypothetical protein N803_16425 [Knoellia subterranea KCTC 19937]
MRNPVPGDPGSIGAAGTAARRAAREVHAASETGTTAYRSLKELWATATSVRTRKEGQLSLSALARGGREADAVGAALQAYAADLSELQARARRVLDSAATAGLSVDGGRVSLAWGVTGEADVDAARDRAALMHTLQQELDGLAAQHRVRRDRLVGELEASTRRLDAIATDVRLG